MDRLSPLKDAHDHLKAAIAEIKGIGNEPSMSIYKAMHALTHALTEVNERGHYAEGTAALAMKHRDEAEARLAEARKVLEQIATARRLSREDMQRIAGDTVRAIPVTGETGK